MNNDLDDLFNEEEVEEKVLGSKSKATPRLNKGSGLDDV